MVLINGPYSTPSKTNDVPSPGRIQPLNIVGEYLVGSTSQEPHYNARLKRQVVSVFIFHVLCNPKHGRAAFH